MTYPKLLSLRGHHFYARLINKDSIVVDLGANRGDFSSQITSIFGCKSYAVEASPRLFSMIPQSPLIKKFNCLINHTNEAVQFNLALNDECSSINHLPDEMNQEVLTLEGVTLEKFLDDNNIKNIDLLKVDIEGAEIELFDSLSDATICSIKQLTVEFHDFMEYFGDMETKVQNIKNRLNKLDFFCIVYSWKTNEDVLFLNKRYCNISNLEYLYLKYIDKYIKGIRRRLKRMIQDLKK